MQKVGIIALSSPCREDILNDAVEFLESKGLQVEIALDPVSEYGSSKYLFSSDSPIARARALENLLLSPDIDLVFSARGAYGTVEILPELDFAKLKGCTTPLVGFSDTTAALVALWQLAGIPTIHGPSASSLSSQIGAGQGQQDAESVFRYLRGEDNSIFQGKVLESLLFSGEAEGKLLGGNLTLLASLVGTPWQPNFAEAVLFFEDVQVRPYALLRLLMQLKLSGAFQGLRGVVVGRLSGCEHPKGLGPSALDCIKEVFHSLSVPVLYGAPFGHDGENLPVPIGQIVKISSQNSLELK